MRIQYEAHICGRNAWALIKYLFYVVTAITFSTFRLYQDGNIWIYFIFIYIYQKTVHYLTLKCVELRFKPKFHLFASSNDSILDRYVTQKLCVSYAILQKPLPIAVFELEVSTFAIFYKHIKMKNIQFRFPRWEQNFDFLNENLRKTYSKYMNRWKFGDKFAIIPTCHSANPIKYETNKLNSDTQSRWNCCETK